MTDKNIGNVRHDALVARVWEAIGTYSVQVATTGELAPSTALRDAIEALAAPAEGGQGEAVKWERRVVNKKTGSIHYDWCGCSQAEFDVGSTEGSTLRVEYRALYTTPPAASVDLEQFREAVLCMQWAAENGKGQAAQIERAKGLLALIDSAGGAKCECNLVRTCRVCKENAERFNA